MLPPQPQTACNAQPTCERRNVQQWHVPHRVERVLFEIRVSFVVEIFVLEFVESRGKNNVAGEQDPDGCGGKNVVDGRDVVEPEEHVNIACSSSRTAVLEVRPSGLLGPRGCAALDWGFDIEMGGSSMWFLDPGRRGACW
jgi:hypothetical protein